MGRRGRISHLLGGTAALALLIGAGAARAEDVALNIAPQPLGDALNEFAVQSKQGVVFAPGLVASKTTRGVNGAASPEIALAQLLDGTGLTFRNNGDTFLIIRADDPQSGSAAGGGATVEALIVTAQKREEDIQDVPIAISAFSQEDLTRSQVAGGPDLMTQVPNMTFTKTNFSSYSVQIRGIGTQAISATTDPAVAIAFNNTPFIRNHFFEQEFYDLQRVEVLRGPQGTLYGRNATAGVVNVISAKPKFTYEAKLSGDIANYNSTRLEGMINLPLVEDVVAMRLAGAWTKRDGFATNQITGNPIDGRDLWSTRASLRFEPAGDISANLIWEHFEEDDDRLRSGKQLCHTDEVTNISGQFPDGTPFSFDTTHYQTLPERGQPLLFSGVQGTFSQGCTAASLYSPDSFEVPNGLSLPYYLPLQQIGLDIVNTITDPYVSRFQSRDLRQIESTVDPHYGAEADVVELQFDIDLPNNLTLTSETGWLSDTLFSTQDFNRFNTVSGIFRTDRPAINENGEFCDPQIGCADRLVAVDLSRAESTQFSQEFRLASNYDGPFNFSLGANFLRYDTEDKYYVFINTLTETIVSQGMSSGAAPPEYDFRTFDGHHCLTQGLITPNPDVVYNAGSCTFVDNNPIGALNDLGHNYFLSRNPYKLISYAVFGEAYYNIADNLKVTAGLRWTVDKKDAPRIPSWVLAGGTDDDAASGAGYTVAEVVEQEWREPTGRLTVDWKPDLSFTDETLLYASYAHGYKAGGANPPTYGQSIYCLACGGSRPVANALLGINAAHPKTFDPEFVNAYEIGTKNTLADGRVTLNLAGFYYDYEGYQISQIVDRSAANLNFDAEVWGIELEGDWRPVENFRLGLKVGYENTRVADGESAIDLMDRANGGRPDENGISWVVVSPFPTFPSNCILPAYLFVATAGGLNGGGGSEPHLVNLGGPGGGNPSGCELAYALGLDPITALPYVANPTVSASLGSLGAHPGYAGFDPATAPNGGAGFSKDLSGNELPNAPHYTATLTADYTVPLPSDWLMTLHTDLYYQSEAWTRIFNTEGYDKLKAYTNVNLAAIFTNEDAGWKVMAYVKNVFDRDSITGAFLNSDDTGLTTNVFLTEPRLYGLRVTKEWSGGPWWTGANPNHPAGEPYDLTVEIGGQVQRHDAPYATLRPSWYFDDEGDPQFSAATDPLTPQHRDLDWGDGRDVKLTWRPEGSPWFVSGGIRYAKTNGSTPNIHQDEIAGPKVCAVPSDYQGGLFAKLLCDPTFDFYGYIPAGYYYNEAAVVTPRNWSDATARGKEDHLFIDFQAGRDVGMGLMATGRSQMSAGLRYAHLQSTSVATMNGIANFDLPDGFIKYYANADALSASFDAEREFKGTGPTLTWEAAVPLIQNGDTGHLDIDWSLTGGVLFGKQKTEITGEEKAYHFYGKYYGAFVGAFLDNVTPTPVDIHRSKSATVPLLDLSLGLSYEAQRVKVSTGYRWERYFDAVDGGFAERESFDRTIDGPYFKLAVGFGG